MAVAEQLKKKLSNSSKKNYRKLRKKINSDIELWIQTNF
jgi:hypothetical protein